MTQARFRRMYAATTGLNNVVDPVRLAFDYRTGVVELAQAINVDIDRSGRVSRRLGRTERSSIAASCAWAHGEVCLFVSSTSLMQMKSDFSTVTLRTGLTLGARMRYAPVADRVYYTNGHELGYVRNRTSFTWSKGNYVPPGDTSRQISDPPVGHVLGWFAGRVVIAKENVLFASEPSFYGAFDLHRGVRPVPSRVTMIQGAPGGLWVGTTTQVLFFRGTQWGKLRREVKANYGVLPGSDALCQGEKRGVAGRSVMFTTPQGICAGEEDGGFTNLTYNKLTFPTGRYASAAVVGDRYILLIEP
jgi:hypothetical protein